MLPDLSSLNSSLACLQLLQYSNAMIDTARSDTDSEFEILFVAELHVMIVIVRPNKSHLSVPASLLPSLKLTFAG